MPSSRRRKRTAKAVLDGIKAVLKDPQIRVTPPPSLKLECSDEKTEKEDERLLDLWLQNDDKPETELLRAAISSMNLYNVLGWDSTAQQEAAKKLLLRQQARVGKLIQQYGGDREKMLAIAAYGMIVVRNMELLGSQALEGEQLALASKIANYVASFIDPLISDIKTKHDYKMMRPAFLVARWAGLLGANEVKLDEGVIGRAYLCGHDVQGGDHPYAQLAGTGMGAQEHFRYHILPRLGEWEIQAHRGRHREFRLIRGRGTRDRSEFSSNGDSREFRPLRGDRYLRHRPSRPRQRAVRLRGWAGRLNQHDQGELGIDLQVASEGRRVPLPGHAAERAGDHHRPVVRRHVAQRQGHRDASNQGDPYAEVKLRSALRSLGAAQRGRGALARSRPSPKRTECLPTINVRSPLPRKGPVFRAFFFWLTGAPYPFSAVYP